MEKERKCIKCLKYKEEKAFSTGNICCDCKSEYAKQYRANNKEKLKEYEKIRNKNPKRIAWKKKYLSQPGQKILHAKQEKIRRRSTPEAQILSRAKSRAKKKGYKFNININDIYIPKRCPVLGLKLIISDKPFDDCSISLDRINPKKGYIKNNIIVVSNRVNKIKNNATIKELIKIADFYKKYKD